MSEMTIYILADQTKLPVLFSEGYSVKPSGFIREADLEMELEKSSGIDGLVLLKVDDPIMAEALSYVRPEEEVNLFADEVSLVNPSEVGIKLAALQNNYQNIFKTAVSNVYSAIQEAGEHNPEMYKTLIKAARNLGLNGPKEHNTIFKQAVINKDKRAAFFSVFDEKLREARSLHIKNGDKAASMTAMRKAGLI